MHVEGHVGHIVGKMVSHIGGYHVFKFKCKKGFGGADVE